jgi:trehalose-6-phosphatase
MFCCYAREDLNLLRHLEQHLAVFRREGLAMLWADVYMDAGTVWEEAIHRHLETAQIVLLLISPAFLNSDACFQEMGRALAREQRGEVRVIPILLRPVNWKQMPFRHIQMLPHEAKPVESSAWPNRDEALEQVTEGIRQVIVSILTKQRAAEPSPHSPATPSMFASVRFQWRRSPVLVGVLLLLIFGLVTEGSIGIWGAVSTFATAQAFGRTWHMQTSNTSADLYDVVWSGSLFVAVGENGTILTSVNGSTWQTQTSVTSAILHGVAGSGSLFVAVGENGTILTSVNGSTWQTQISNTSAILHGVVWSGSLFVAVGENGTILTSANGSTWQTQISNTSADLYDVAWSGSLFVAVGENGTILTSANGSIWQTQASVTSAILHDVVWSSTLFVAVGENGTILTSANGSTWQTQISNTSVILLHGVVWSGSLFVAVGENGTILTSVNGSTWQTQTSNPSADLRGVAWSSSLFVVVGEKGTILTS